MFFFFLTNTRHLPFYVDITVFNLFYFLKAATEIEAVLVLLKNLSKVLRTGLNNEAWLHVTNVTTPEKTKTNIWQQNEMDSFVLIQKQSSIKLFAFQM